jgi:hypothetical protein
MMPDASPSSRQEPGSEDNRLSLNPNDPNWQDTLAAWKDGGEYKVTLTISQISPGEFQVTALESETPEEDAGETGEEGGANAPAPKAKSGYSNPAVAALAEQE